MGTSNKDRQAAFKARMKTAGKRALPVWVDAEQEMVIRAFLAGTPLPVTEIAEIEAREQALAAHEADLAAREVALKANEEECSVLMATTVKSLEEERQRYHEQHENLRLRSENLTKAEEVFREQRRDFLVREKQMADMAADLESWKQRSERLDREYRRLRDLFAEKSHEIDRLHKELRDASKAIKGKITLAAPSSRERARVLLEKIDKFITWRGDVQVNASRQVLQSAERLGKIVQGARAASTSLEKVKQELADIVTEGEAEILDYARQALAQITEAAVVAKEQGKRLANKRKAHEEAVDKAASAAVDGILSRFGIEEQVLFAAWGGELGYEFESLSSGKAFNRFYTLYDGVSRKEKQYPQDILAKTLREAVEVATSNMCYLVRQGMKEPKDAERAAQVVYADVQKKMQVFRPKYARLAEKVKVELIARQIEKASQ